MNFADHHPCYREAHLLMSTTADLAIIGGGIVGCATALALIAREPGLRIVLFEKESQLAAHQTGHNSGVIHSGLDYKPGSLKAANCVAGATSCTDFCAGTAVYPRTCGKVVVASRGGPAGAELERRGRANGLEGLRRLSAAEVHEHEPHVRGVAGLLVPETGIVDYCASPRSWPISSPRAEASSTWPRRSRGSTSSRTTTCCGPEAVQSGCAHWSTAPGWMATTAGLEAAAGLADRCSARTSTSSNRKRSSLVKHRHLPGPHRRCRFRQTLHPA